MYDQIDPTSSEVQHLISNVEHMMTYLKTILGRPGGSTVYENTSDAKNAVISQHKILNGVLDEIRSVKSAVKKTGTEILGAKVGEMEKELRTIKRTLYETQHMISELGTR